MRNRRRLGALSSVWVLQLALTFAARAEHVAVQTTDASSYSGTGDRRPTRAAVATEFYRSHADAYDFLVVLPTFDPRLEAEPGLAAVGLHWTVRNEVQGIGLPLLDLGPEFGSAARLKGYVDVSAFAGTGAARTVDAALAVIAHEVAHQYTGRVKYIDAAGQLRDSLLGLQGTHWSYFLDSDASVLYGSKWRDEGGGQFTSVESRRRYSALDRYLMGLIGPAEVSPFKVLRPTPEVAAVAADAPPPDGTRISATAELVTIQNIIAAHGARVPAASEAQKVFRTAFIALAPTGTRPTAGQLAFVESVRQRWASEFFFLTQGKGVMETELVEVSPEPVATNPSVASGLTYLLGRQGTDGSFADHASTALRDTQASVEALSLFGADPRVGPVLSKAGDYLEGSATDGVDTTARRLLGLAAVHRPVSQALERLKQHVDSLGMNMSGGYGYSFGYVSNALDSALAGRAICSGGGDEQETARLVEYLLSSQVTGGGWPALPGGPPTIGATAQAVLLLAEAPRTSRVAIALSAAAAFIRSLPRSNGLIGDGASAAPTALGLLSLDRTGQLLPAEARASADALLRVQRPDGSWGGTAHETAEVLKALRTGLTPNLTVDVADVSLSSTSVLEREPVVASVTVRNLGYADAAAFAVRVYDGNGAPFAGEASITSLAPGASTQVSLVLDTSGHGGTSQVYVVVDPNGLVDELREDDNRAARPLSIQLPPAGPELYVSSASLAAAPSAITRIPTLVTVTATVGNLGMTSVDAVDVDLSFGGNVVSTTTVALAAQSSTVLHLAAWVNAAQASLPVTVTINRSRGVAEQKLENNQASMSVPMLPTADLGVSSAVVSPAASQQGQDVTISFQVWNAGTVIAEGASAQVTIQNEAGAVVATLPTLPLTLNAGASAAPSLRWRANRAGQLRAFVSVSTLGDVDEGNNSVWASFSVEPSALANVTVRPGGIHTEPAPPPQGQPAVVSAVIDNEGAVSAGQFEAELFRGNPANGGVLLGTKTVTGVTGGQNVTVSWSVTFDQASTQTLVVRLDAANLLEEFDETDNTTVLQVTPSSIPDLVVTAADIQPENEFPKEGDVVPVRVSLRNAGGQSASNVGVDLFLGDPDAGGSLLGSSRISVQGGATGEVQFSFSTAGKQGALTLVAVVNADRAVSESRTDNNRASRELNVQNADLALTNPFFSPNGDGVKDGTDLLYRLPSAGDLTVSIVDARGRQVRELVGPTAAQGRISWDGRAEDGRIAKDGRYDLIARAGGALVGQVSAVLDTNSSSLVEVLGTNLLVTDNIESHAYVYNDAAVVNSAMIIPDRDETGVFFVATLKPDKSWVSGECPKLVFQPLGEGDPVYFTQTGRPECWPLVGDMSLATSRDGDSLAYRIGPPASWQGATWQATPGTRVLSLRTKATHDLPLPTGYIHQGLGRFEFSPGGERILAPVTTDLQEQLAWNWNRTLYNRYAKTAAFRTDGSQSVVLSDPKYTLGWDAYTREFEHSPDGRFIARRLNGWLDVVEANAYTNRKQLGQFQVYTTYEDEYRYIAPVRMMNWMSDSRIAFIASKGTPYPDRGRVAIVDVETGPQKTYDFEGARYLNTATATLSATDHGIAVGPLYGGSQPQVLFLSRELDAPTYFTAGSSTSWLTWSPRGTMALASNGSWWQATSRSYTAFYSAGNLATKLRAVRRSAAGPFVLKGTAADWNFEEYSIIARSLTDGSVTVVERSPSAVIKGELGQWAPSKPGIYELALTTRDRAGNSRTQRTKLAWSASSAIENVTRSPVFFSPNADTKKDRVAIRYSATKPVSALLSLSNASGTVVRSMMRTHLEPESSEFLWDGTDDSGQPLPDGVYDVRLDSYELPVTLDNTPPKLDLVFKGNVMGAAGFERTLASGVTSGGQQVKVPRLGLGIELKAGDDHFEQWTLSSEGRIDATSSQELRTGTSQATTKVSFPAGLLRSRTLKGVARDLAENEAVKTLNADERVFAMAAGPAEKLGSLGDYVSVDGEALPRIDRLDPLFELDATGASIDVAGVFRPTEYAFAIAQNVGEPLVRFDVAFRPKNAGASAFTLQENVPVLANQVLLWDATAVPEVAGGYELEIRAHDGLGRTFVAPVVLRTFKPMQVCPVVGSDALAVRIEDVSIGAVLSFVPAGGTVAETSFPIYPGENVLNTTSLRACEYDLRVTEQGTTSMGPSVSVCRSNVFALTVSAGEGAVRLYETERQGILYSEIYLVDGNARIPIGTLGTFQQWSKELRFPIPESLGCGASVKVVTETRLADGTIRRGGTDDGGGSCKGVPSVAAPCATVAVTTTRDSVAPYCQVNRPTHSVMVIADGRGSALESVTASVTPLNGGAPLAVPLVGHVPGESFASAVGRLDSALLAEGAYTVSATATLGSGQSVSAEAKSPVVVDRAPPTSAVWSPVTGGEVCPIIERDAKGVERHFLEVYGTVADAHPESFEVLMRHAGGSFSPLGVVPLAAPVSGLLRRVDVTGLPGGDYELMIDAKDVSGGGACSPSVAFRLNQGPEVTGVRAEPAVFSPDSDRLFDSTLIPFVLATPGQVTVSLEQGGASLGNVFQGAFPSGASGVEWSGRLLTGVRPPDGAYTIRVAARDACANTVSAAAAVVLDTTAPVARIDSPRESEVVGSSLTVSGEATDAQFEEFMLELEDATAPGVFRTVALGSAPSKGALATVSTGGLSPGPYVLRLTVTDAVGHVSTALRGFQVGAKTLIDGFAVAPVGVSPNGDGQQDQATAALDLKTPATVVVELVTTAGQVLASFGPNEFDAGLSTVLLSGASLDALPDGEYTVRAVASAGGTTDAATTSLVVDRQPPTILISAPVAHSFVKPELDVQGSVDESAVSWTLRLRIPSGSSANVASGAAPTTGRLAHLSGLGEGEHELTLEAVDSAGNLARSSARFTVDAVPPAVAFLHPVNGAFLSGQGGPTAIKGSVVESNLRKVRLELQPHFGPARTLFEESALPPDGSLVAWAVAAEQDGAGVLVLTAEDSAGNVGRSLIDVVVDNTAPVAHIDSPRDGLALVGAFEGTAYDANLTSWVLSIASGTPETAGQLVPLASGTGVVNSGVLASLATLPADGAYTVELVANDKAGNRTVDRTGFKIDSIPPLPASGLVAEVVRPNNVRLTWGASTSSDVAGYRILRGSESGAMLPVSSQLALGTEYIDPGVRDGSYRYQVVAVDSSGLSSEASNTAQAVVDTNPPSVAIRYPLASQAVSGMLLVVGSAYGSDLMEYRLSVGQGAAPTVFSQIARRTTQVVNDELGQLDVTTLPPGSIQTLRLEAEDFSGNVAETRVTFTVDNSPPAAPVLVSVTASGSTVTVTWAANSEPDLLGYLVYRDGAIANNPGGASFSDVLPFVIKGTSFQDADIPDGTHTYQVQALDFAQNFSSWSNSLVVTTDTRAPKAVIVSPAPLSRLDGRVLVSAETVDADIRSVSLEAREAGSGTYRPLSSVTSTPPYSGILDPTTFASPLIEVRAVATDVGGRTDPAPESIAVFFDLPVEPPSVSTLVDARSVTVRWSDPNPSGRVSGYIVQQDSVRLLGDITRPAGVTSASSRGTQAIYGYDGSTSSGWTSDPVLPQTWDVVFNSPALISSVSANLSANSDVELYAQVKGIWVRLTRTVVGSSGLLSLGLEHLLEVKGIRVRFVGGPLSAMVREVSVQGPVTVAGSSRVVPNVAYGDHVYSVEAVTAFGGKSSGQAPARIYAPTLTASASTVTGSPAVLNGSGVASGSTVNLIKGGVTVAQVSATGTGTFTASVPVVPGVNTFYAQAVDSLGNKSDVSPSASVTYVVGPSANIVLSLGGVSGSDVALSFTRATAPDVAGYELRRSSNGASETVVAKLGPSAKLGEPVAADPTQVVEGRDDAASVVLADGRVLVVGGQSAGVPSNAAYLYDPSLGTWSAARSMLQARGSPVAVLLQDGRVLVTGGAGTTAELYSPSTNSWTQTGATQALHEGGATLTRLADGRAVLLGGSTTTAEYFHPSWGSWFSIKALPSARRGHTATLQSDGSLLVVGGTDVNGNRLSECWRYEPAWNWWYSAPSLVVPVSGHTTNVVATASGTRFVVIGGGFAQVWTGGSNAWRLGSVPFNMADTSGHSATVLGERVLVLGGSAVTAQFAEEYDVTADLWRKVTGLPEPRSNHRAHALASGNVLVTATYGTGPLLLRQGADISYVDAHVANGSHTYVVAPLSSSGVAGTLSNSVTATVSVPSPTTPSGAFVTAPESGAKLLVQWQHAGSLTQRFVVERALAISGPFTAVASVSVRQFLDAPLENGRRYFYRISAMDAAGNRSSASETVSGVPSDTVPPPAPVIDSPTTVGASVVSNVGTTVVKGAAEYGASVDLFSNGSRAGTVLASTLDQATSAIGLQRTPVSPLAASVHEGRIAYLSLGTGGEKEIVLEDLGTGVPPRVFNRVGTNFEAPIFSPDGQKLVVAGGNSTGEKHLYLVDIAAGSLSRLLSAVGTEESGPVWSPDSTRIAFSSRLANGPRRAVIFEVSSGVERVVGQDNLAPYAWSPLGEALIAARYSSSTGKVVELVSVEAESGQWSHVLSGIEIGLDFDVPRNGGAFAVTADGVAYVVRLAPLAVLSASYLWESAQWPAVSPDGKWVAFFSSGSVRVRELANSNLSIWGSYPSNRLLWRSSGELLVASGAGLAQRRSVGRFELGGVPLSPGSNYIGAVAADPAGNRSSPSGNIEVVYQPSTSVDLAVSARLQPEVPLAGEVANALVNVTNLGNGVASSPVLLVAVLGSDGSIRSSAPISLAGFIGPGATVSAAVPLNISGLAGAQTLRVVVDPSGVIPDVDRSNNELNLPFTVASERSTAVAVALSAPEVAANGWVTAQAQVINTVGTLDARVRIALVTPAGEEAIVAAPDELFSPLPSGTAATVTRAINVGTTLAGAYYVRATVYSGDALVAQAQAPLVVSADVSTSLRFTASRSYFFPGEQISLQGELGNQSINAQLAGATYVVVLRDSTDVEVFRESTSVPVVPRGGTWRATTLVGVPLAQGRYTARAEVLAQGRTVASATAALEIMGEPRLVGTLTVQGREGNPALVPAGEVAGISLSLGNEGTAGASGVAGQLSIVDMETQSVVWAESLSVGSMVPGTTWTASRSVSTVGWALRSYLVVLSGSGDGVPSSVLATTKIRITDPAAPVLSSASLLDGSYVGASVAITVQAEDTLSGTASVRAEVGGQWTTPLALTSGTPSSGLWTGVLELPAEGAQLIRLIGVDREGNDGALRANAQNPLQLTLIRDTVAPTVSLEGVSEGAMVSHALVPGVNAFDLNLAKVELRLDGALIEQGTPIQADGAHVLRATAVDKAGNEANAVVHFTLDQTPPEVVITGVVDGEYANHDVTPQVSVRDLRLLSSVMTLDGAPFQNGSVVTGEGTHTLLVEASDEAGNSSSVVVRFTIDRTAPVLSLSGVQEGSYLAGAVAPVFSASDAHLASVQGTVDGVPFTSGDTVSTEGVHILRVTAVDAAGNSTQAQRTFTLDVTAPTITVEGVADGLFSASPVTVAYRAADAALRQVTATIDDAAVTSGALVETEGAHVVVVSAEDQAGNVSRLRLMFTLDFTAPTVTVSGVVEGELRSSFEPSFSATDPYLASVSATLDGAEFISGTVVNTPGPHTLVVTAQDLAGNTGTRTVSFVVGAEVPRFQFAACAIESLTVDGNATIGRTDVWSSVASEGTLTLSNNVVVTGDAVSGSVALLQNRARVEGRLFHGGVVQLLHGSTVVGGTQSVAPAPAPCSCRYDLSGQMAMARVANDNARLAADPSISPFIVNGALVLPNGASVSLPSGKYYFSSLTMEGASRLTVAPGAEVKLFIDGPVDVRNTATLGAPENAAGALVLISSARAANAQQVSVLNHSAAALQIYAPEADVVLANNTQLTGAIVGRRLMLGNSQVLLFGPQAQASPPPLSCSK